MKSKIVSLIIITLLISANSALAVGGDSHREHEKAVVKVGNKLCPVSGENVEDMGGGIEREYNGKIYNLCCAGCVDIFEKDPEKYSKIAEESVKGEHKGSDHPY